MPYNDQEQFKTVEQQKHDQLPNDIDAEKAVLSACILSQDALDQIASELLPENFYRVSHRVIFEAIQELFNAGNRADIISLADKLQAKGKLDEAGGRSYLADLNDNTLALAGWSNHMEIVKRFAMQRELIKAAAEIHSLAYDAPDDLNDVVGMAESKLFNVTEKQVSSSFVKIDKLVTEAFEELSRLSESDTSIVGVPSGFKDVDNLIHGFRGGDLIILAARPSVGKTAFALNMAVNAAKAGTAVAFFALEMPSVQLTQRMLCSEAGISLEKIRSGNFPTGEWTAIAEAAGVLSNLDMHFDDTSDLSVTSARAKARRELRHVMGTDKKGLIIIDYLQLMSPPKGTDSRRDVQVGEISRGLKILAKEMNVPVIALAQLNRAVEMRTDKRPMLADLRESGSIEQDADIVMFIDRSKTEEEASRPERPDFGTANLMVQKHRNGAIGDIKLQFSPEYTRFGDFFDDSRY